MKKTIFLIIALISFSTFLYLRNSDTEIIPPLPKDSQKDYEIQDYERFVFVPYWTVSEKLDIEEYDSIIYFGVTFDENGLKTSEDGYKMLSTFLGGVSEEKKIYLTVRMLSDELNKKILSDGDLQNKVGSAIARVAQEHGFDGVVVDYETSALGFMSIEEKITNMYEVLQGHVKGEGLEFFVTVFGDTFYRGRPYDISKVANLSDGVIIMAYDFHKARFNPGPNFPLSGKEIYGYDLKSMIEDFRKDMEQEKIIVTLGYFGYDWALDENGVNMGIAKSLSTNQGISRYMNNCLLDDCEIEKNLDNEISVQYKDEERVQHEVWFETEESVNKKIEFLHELGINRIAFWAYSYF